MATDKAALNVERGERERRKQSSALVLSWDSSSDANIPAELESTLADSVVSRETRAHLKGSPHEIRSFTLSDPGRECPTSCIKNSCEHFARVLKALQNQSIRLSSSIQLQMSGSWQRIFIPFLRGEASAVRSSRAQFCAQSPRAPEVYSV